MKTQCCVGKDLETLDRVPLQILSFLLCQGIVKDHLRYSCIHSGVCLSSIHISTSTNAPLLYVHPVTFSGKYWNEKQHQRAYIEKHGVIAMFSYGLFFFHVYLETYWQS